MAAASVAINNVRSNYLIIVARSISGSATMAVERVGVSFEPELLSKFDAMIRGKGYASRSEALRDLARESILKDEVALGEGDVVGTLTILYDHERGDVTHRLLHIQHDHHAEVLSTLHVHVDERNCLEVLVLRGKASDVKHLAEGIRAIKGVLYGELVMTKITP